MSCAIELAQGKPTRRHIEFALSRVRMLLHFGVEPYIVFDGDYLPSKAHTEKERAAKRKESRKLGLDLLRMGRTSQAYLELQKAIDVTPIMARELIEELKRLDVPFIVAPYEADSQLAYLEKQGIISGVLSEDSDLLVFGVKCLLTKLDQYGECVMVNRADFTACREISLVGWTDKEFRIMAMLSGCDYLPGIDKMGLKTAYRLVRTHKVIERIVRTVQFDGKMKVPAGYLEAFTKAERTFLYQWVYCPEERCLVNLNKLPAELDAASLTYIGKQVNAEIATGVATGELDPNSKQRLVVSYSHHHRASFRSNINQTPVVEKQGKPISEFFKPRRTPLAELDPNSFTPSPSQQQLLRDQQNSSWSASQVPNARPSALSRVASASGPSSAPQATGRAVSDQLFRRSRTSPKRQRLCSDSALAASMNGSLGVETATSRFFSKQNTQPSPSLRKGSTRKKDDFELWSDDSVAEAAAAMTAAPESVNVEQTPSPKKRKRKKIQVYEDPESEGPDERTLDAPASAKTSQETVITSISAASVDEADDETSATSFEEVEEHVAESTVFTKGINGDFASLQSKFSFRSSLSPKKSSRTKSLPTESRDPMKEIERNAVLGRLAASAPAGKAKKASQNTLERSRKCEEDDRHRVPTSSPLVPPTCVREDDHEDTISNEEWLELEQQHASQSAMRGSEDCLIPNSPDSTEDNANSVPKLRLGQFAFAG